MTTVIKDENGLILPRKIANPCVESPFRRDLHRELNDIGAAQESWARLVAEYPDHALSEQARKRLRSIGAVGADGP